MSEELKVKQRELQDLKENNKLNSSSLPMDSKTIDLCINQMNLLQNAVTAQQHQLKSRTNKEFLLSDQLEQLEVSDYISLLLKLHIYDHYRKDTSLKKSPDVPYLHFVSLRLQIISNS